MKNLISHLQESLRIGINDTPENDWTHIDHVYRVTITNYQLFIDIHYVDSDKLKITDNVINFPDYNSRSFKSMFCDAENTGDFVIDGGILYKDYYDKGLIIVLFHPDMKEHFYNLVNNISKCGERIYIDDVCKLINIPEVTNYIKGIKNIEDKLVVESHDYIIDSVKKFQKTDI